MLTDVSVLMPASSVASSLPPPLEQAASASTLVAATAASAALRVILNFPPEKGGGLCGDGPGETGPHAIQRSAGVWRHGSQANSGQTGQFTERNPIVTRLILSGTSHHLEPAAWRPACFRCVT